MAHKGKYMIMYVTVPCPQYDLATLFGLVDFSSESSRRKLYIESSSSIYKMSINISHLSHKFTVYFIEIDELFLFNNIHYSKTLYGREHVELYKEL
jgi:hypothetical protein